MIDVDWEDLYAEHPEALMMGWDELRRHYWTHSTLIVSQARLRVHLTRTLAPVARFLIGDK